MQHQIFKLRRTLPIFGPITADAFFQEAKIFFLNDFFHSSAKGLTNTFVGHATRKPVQKFERRRGISTFNRHAGGQLRKIGRSAGYLRRNPKILPRPQPDRRARNTRYSRPGTAVAKSMGCDESPCSGLPGLPPDDRPTPEEETGRLIGRNKCGIQVRQDIHGMIGPGIPKLVSRFAPIC